MLFRQNTSLKVWKISLKVQKKKGEELSLAHIEASDFGLEVRVG